MFARFLMATIAVVTLFAGATPGGTDNAGHDFYRPGSASEADAFVVPPWNRVNAELSEQTPVERPQEEVADPTATHKEDLPAGLAGTRWQLVQFQSMDDATGQLIPKDASVYRMSLNADGTVQLRLNCNRATGTWWAKPAGDGESGTFSFGPLAMTKALCPPSSMDERIAKDAGWVRGLLLRDGQLHLSLMADGGIYSWAPLEKGAN